MCQPSDVTDRVWLYVLVHSAVPVVDKGDSVRPAVSQPVDETNMSVLRKAKDLRDRIKVAQGKPQHAPIRTGIRARNNPGRKGGGVKTGISLQYKSLQDPGFEAVLDEIDQYSNPVFGGGEEDKAMGTVAKEAVGGGEGKKRVSGRETTVLDESLFPPSDDEEEGVSSGGGGGQYTGVDPLLGQVMSAGGDSGHTDSDESEEEEEEVEVEQLVLDAETVNVLESLHLTSSGGLCEEFSESPPIYGIAGGEEQEETRDRNVGRGGEEEEEEKEGGRRAHLMVLNESANNNTQVPSRGESLENVKEETSKEEGHPPVIDNPLLPHSDVEIRVQVTNTIASASPPHTASEQGQLLVDKQYDGKQSDLPSPAPVSLEDLLERGSAALHPPHHPSPRSLQSSPQDSTPSPLTSSYETDEQFFSIRNPPPQTTPTAEIESSLEKETHIDTPPQPVSDHSPHGVGGALRRSSEGEVKGLQIRSESMAGNPTATATSLPHAAEHKKVMQMQHIQEEERERVMERGARGLTPTREHPLNPNATESEDELFPDDAKYLQDSPEKEKGGGENLESQTSLEIKDDHFSASPGEQRKKPPVPRQQNPRPPVPQPLPPRLLKQNSEGKVPPPRPPRSPQLQRKLLQKQQKERTLSKTQPPSKMQSAHTRTTHSSMPRDVERAKLKIVHPLGTAPRDLISATTTSSPPKLSPRVALRDQAVPDGGSSVDPPTLPPSAPTKTSSQDDDLFKDEETETSTSTWAADEGLAEPPFFPLSTHLLIAGLLYIYYALNPFVYLAGLLAGFLTFYLVLGAVFILYVQNEDDSSREMVDTPTLQLSDDDLKLMEIKFDEYVTRFKVNNILSVCVSCICLSTYGLFVQVHVYLYVHAQLWFFACLLSYRYIVHVQVNAQLWMFAYILAK